MIQQRDTSGESSQHSSFLSSPLASIVAVGLLLIAMCVVGYLFLNRLEALESQARALNQRVDTLAKETEFLSEIAASARSSALQAEEFARIAAEGRNLAERGLQDSNARARLAEEQVRAARADALTSREELERFKKEREAEMQRLYEALGQIVETRRTALGLVMSLGSDRVEFDFDKADLKPKNRELLSRIAGVLLTSQGYRVQVYGHTDDVGTEEYNQDLSERRAETVRDYLVEAGIPTDIISAKGFGKTNPLVAGTDDKARARNRRVEIGIIDTLIKYAGPIRE